MAQCLLSLSYNYLIHLAVLTLWHQHFEMVSLPSGISWGELCSHHPCISGFFFLDMEDWWAIWIKYFLLRDPAPQFPISRAESFPFTRGLASLVNSQLITLQCGQSILPVPRERVRQPAGERGDCRLGQSSAGVMRGHPESNVCFPELHPHFPMNETLSVRGAWIVPDPVALVTGRWQSHFKSESSAICACSR